MFTHKSEQMVNIEGFFKERIGAGRDAMRSYLLRRREHNNFYEPHSYVRFYLQADITTIIPPQRLVEQNKRRKIRVQDGVK